MTSILDKFERLTNQHRSVAIKTEDLRNLLDVARAAKLMAEEYDESKYRAEIGNDPDWVGVGWVVDEIKLALAKLEAKDE